MKVRALHRKRRRDLWQMKTQAIAIALVIGSGVATFVMSVSTYTSLRELRDRYYERHAFAHVFAHLVRAPRTLADRVRTIPGVARADPRIIADVTLDLADLEEPASGRLVSLPPVRDGMLNRLHLREGRFPEPGRRREAVLNEAFAEAHGFRPGDTFHAVLNGRRERLEVVGVALSPEFIYQIRPGELFPDDRRFGVIWMAEDQLAAAFDLEGAFNALAVSLMRGAREDEVIERIDALTEPFGGQGAFTRKDQLSHRYVSDELAQLRAMASIPPAIFLLVAAFLLQVVVARVVRTQRDQIATLKAFGYRSAEIGRHYFGFAAAIIVLGSTLGIGLGSWMGRGLTRLYVQFFRFPEGGYQLEPAVAVAAVAVAAAAGGLAVVSAVREAVRLPPAEAMRPEPPARYRPGLLERRHLRPLFTQGARMVVRHLERQPIKSALASLGIALAVAVLILGTFTIDVVDELIEFQFHTAQRQDLTLTFREPLSPDAVHAVAALPGILRVEPFRSVPARLRAGHRSHQLAVLGLPRDRQLLRIMDLDQREHPLPLDGLVISTKLAEKLAVAAGDLVRLEVLEGARPERTIRVTALLDDFSGTSAYLEIGSLNRLMREGAVVTGVHALVDRNAQAELYEALKRTPEVAGVSLKLAAIRSFEETMSENLLRMRFYNMIFAGIIAFGVVYNSARISLAERSRELATLRVLGFRRAEVSSILLGEVAVVTAVALAPGILMGHGLAALAVHALQTETQRFPFVVNPVTDGIAVLTVIAASAVSALVVRLRIDRLDLVAVLKSRE